MSAERQPGAGIALLQAPAHVPARVWIGVLMFALTTAAYVQRTAISVAAERIMPEQGLSQAQIGWLETAFLLTYTVLQYPGSVIAAPFGSRRALSVLFLGGVAATLAVPFLPGVAAGTLFFVLLVVSQMALGVAQAPLFGIASATLERWFPSPEWPVVQGFMSAGIGVGSAIAPVAIAGLMLFAGWRVALMVVALPVLGLIGVWWWYGRDTPAEHWATTPAERAAVTHAPPETTQKASWKNALRMAACRDVLLLAASYACMNFAFYLITYWSFLYLVQQRHFAVLQSGLLTAIPTLAGAAGAALGGVAGGRMCRRFGPRRGLRIVPLVCLPACGALLLAAVHATSPAVAVASLALSFGMAEMTEGSFWAAAMEIGQTDTAATGSILNTGGNVGGIIATPLVAILSGNGDWNTPFMAGAVFALIGAVLWLVIDTGARLKA